MFKIAVSRKNLLLSGASVIALLTANPAAATTLGGLTGRSATQITSTPVNPVANVGGPISTQTQQSSGQSAKDFSAALAAIQAQLSAQAAARAAAQGAGSNVPDGLTAGGLVVDPRVTAGSDANLWVNLNKPTQTIDSSNNTTVTIEQTGQRAIATWQSFNVGKNTTVSFDQSAGNTTNGNNWVVLNRIDATGAPSVIQGQIKAQGTVLLIDPNGVIFSGSSQVNVHSLVASSEDIYSGSFFLNGAQFTQSAFASSGAPYVPIVVNGAVQTGADGVTIYGPSAEDNANVEFLANGLFIANGNNAPALGLLAAKLQNQTNGGITVQQGAQITTSISGFDNGGFVLLAGPSVTNAGDITTSSGQIILAAGTTTSVSQDSTLLNVSSGAALIGSGTSGSIVLSVTSPTVAENDGLLVSKDGNITLTGDSILQDGVIEATTSITRAGSINILANSAGAGNNLTFGGSSVTAILPDENGETIPTSSVSTFVGPSISINATYIDLQGSSNGAPGALIEAPSAKVSIGTSFSAPTSGIAYTPTGRFLEESGSVIDLGGLAATASASDYLYTFKVTSNDVADSPLAKNLIGQTVTIDLRQSGTRSDGLSWVGSPLFSATGAGYLGTIPKSIDQLLTTGGTVSFTGISNYVPFADVLQQAGSVINVSGGSITYKSANLTTTVLAGTDGLDYNIANANPFISYTGIATQATLDHARWAVSDTYGTPILSDTINVATYIDGISGGGISITASNPILEGTLLASVQIGAQQALAAHADTGTGGTQASPDQLPVGANLSINLTGGGTFADNAVLLQAQSANILGGDFTFASKLNLSAGSYLKLPELIYSTDVLSSAGFGSITFNGASALSEAQGANLTVLPGGSITLSGVTTIDGTLSARAGSISLTGFNPSTILVTPPLAVPPVSALTIGADALLDVSGLWVNDALAVAGGTAVEGAAHINGGTVSIRTYLESSTNNPNFYTPDGSYYGYPQYLLVGPFYDSTQSIVLSKGSVVDLESGGYVGTNGKLLTAASGLPAGNAGNLSLLTYVLNTNGNYGGDWTPVPKGPLVNYSGMPPFGNFLPNDGNMPNAANIFLEGTIYDAGLAKGGTLTLQAPTIQIGGVTEVSDITSGSQAGTLALPASFFANNGFSSYSLTSVYSDITVVAGTTVPLQQLNYLIGPSAVLPGTGATVRDFATLGLAALGLRQPVNLSLNELADPVPPTSGKLLVDNGAAIIGDPGAQITLTASGPLTVLGSITAPGGAITLTNYYAQNSTTPTDVWVGADAVLDVSGIYVPNPQITTYNTGSVLAGGTITIDTPTFIALPGSIFDISGASATIQTPGMGLLSNLQLPSQDIWSNGGTLNIGGYLPVSNTNFYQTAYFDGTIKAAGGSPLASGGSLNIAGQDYSLSGYPYTNFKSAVIVTQNGAVTSGLNFAALTTPGADYATTQAQLAALLPMAGGAIRNYDYISADTINNSGLGSVSLAAGRIAFSGNVTLKVPGTLSLAGVETLLPAGNLDPTYSGASVGHTIVNLDAGYISLSNYVYSYFLSVSPPTLSDGTINFNATAQIDITGLDPLTSTTAPGTVAINNAANVNFTSGGDIRLLGKFLSSPITYYSSSTLSSIEQATAFLEVPDNLTLTARAVYAGTDSAVLLQSTGLGSGTGKINTITIASNGKIPITPYSVDGTILVDAQTIVQGGALYAPLGSIILGLSSGEAVPALWNGQYGAAQHAVATQSVTLAPGSVTSVSLDGLVLPYGTTISDINWTASNTNIPLTAPPAKSITLNGATIDSAKGAKIDLSGGGDVYATEFVPGSGGSHNVLTGAASGQTVYALVPSYEAPIAPNDPTFGASNIAPGVTVTLAGGNGIAAGTYTLLPAIYATQPGAYRVVVVSTNANPNTPTSVTMDGSIYTTGILGNAIDGSRSSQTALLEIQSNATWSKYSEIDTTSANTYFPKLATGKGVVAPAIPLDAGVLGFNATTSLTIQSTNDFTPAAGGRGGVATISGDNIVVLAPDQTETPAEVLAGYIVLDSDQLDAIGATALVIGGSVSQGSKGFQINPTAVNLVVNTDAAHPLTAPDLILVAAPSSTPVSVPIDDPFNYGDYSQLSAAGQAGSIDVLSGSVIKAVGDGSSAPSFSLGQNIAALPTTLLESVIQKTLYSGTNPVQAFYNGAYSGGALAALLQVSSGGSAVNVQRGAASAPQPTVTVIDDYYNSPNNYFGSGVQAPPYVIPLPALASVGAINVGANATISGSTLGVEGGNVSFDKNSSISGTNVILSAQTISLGSPSGTTTGLVVTPTLIGQLAGAKSVTLQSSSVIDLYGTVQFGDANTPIGTLTLDSAGLYSDGGAATFVANNIDLTDSQSTPNAAGALSGSNGSLTVDASGALTLGPGVTKLGNFSTVGLTSGQNIVFTGTGSVDAGAAAVTLTSPNVVANSGSAQGLTTTGTLTIAQGAGTAPTLAATDTGGKISLTGGSIVDSGAITALSGGITLTATSGDVVLNSGAKIAATGSHITLFDATEDAPAGTIRLVSNAGNVTINKGATVDVSATGNGYAGMLSILTAPTGTATLDGTLAGGAAYKDLGGNFVLNAGHVSGGLPFAGGFSGSFSVLLGSGDITVPAGVTLTSGNVLLVANGGGVIVDGTIDASGPTGGTIQLYGAGNSTAAAGSANASGVTIGSKAQLLASYKADDAKDPANGNGESTLSQNGGTITLGTTGTPNGSTNATYGYENVDGSGAITVAQGAVFDISGGAGGANISNNGGEIIIRAPILANGNVNVSFAGKVVDTANGGPAGNGLVLDAYAVWSTTDSSTGGQHFDGIIDPAGWFNPDGSQIAGTYYVDPTSRAKTDIFQPTGAVDTNHVTFYQNTLVNFVQTPFDTAAIAADFAGATGINLGSTLHLRPEIDLVNPSTGINHGNITVASNWNLGAGTYNPATGGYSFAYRTTGALDAGEPGTLTLRANNNVQINATISDGFYETSDPFYVAQLGSLVTLGNGYATYDTVLAQYLYADTAFFNSSDMPGLNGGADKPPAPSTFSSSYNTVDQNVWYSEFYRYYLNALTGAYTSYNHSTVSYRAVGASGTTFDNNPNDYASYTAYLSAYNANYAGINAVTGEPAALTHFDNNPLDYANYAAYVSAYQSYETAFVSFATGYYAANPQQTTNLPSPLLAPAPPPAYGTAYETGNTGYILDYQSYTSSAYRAYSNYFNYKVEPGNVTGTAAASSNLWLVALPYLPSITVTPELPVSSVALPGPANAIANNPGVNYTFDNLGNPVTVIDYNTTSAENLMPLGLGGSQGSFTYNFVGGAAGLTGTPAADPNSVITVAPGTVTSGANASDSVTVNGHTSYPTGGSLSYFTFFPHFQYGTIYQTIDVPTLVRTGTGSIDINAAGSFELLDTAAPGAVYTAGAAAPLSADFTAPTVPANVSGPQVQYRTYPSAGLVSTPTWGIDGGAVTINVGDAIIGIEAPVDDSNGSQTYTPNGLTGQFWTAWYYKGGFSSGETLAPFDANFVYSNGTAVAHQDATWVNYATFFQGLGALGGGNVSLKAGGNIYDISASLPETIQVSGGQSVGGPVATAHYYGGGDLLVQAGGSLYSSAFYVGRGTGTIIVGGTVATDPLNPVTGTATTYYNVNSPSSAPGSNTGNANALPLLLAVQDGFISVTAPQSVSLGGMFDPGLLPQDVLQASSTFLPSAVVVPGGARFGTYGPNSGIALTSTSGDVAVDTLAGLMQGSTTLFDPNYSGFDATIGRQVGVGETYAPAMLDVTSVAGNIRLASNLAQVAAPTGTINFLAGGSINDTTIGTYGQLLTASLAMMDGTNLNPLNASDLALPTLLGVPAPTTLTAAVHANDPAPVLIYAGGDITGNFYFIKPAKLEAGGNIVNTNFTGQNNNPGDVTSIIAGGSILAQQVLVPGFSPIDTSSTYELYGPGSFVIEAGKNIGPFFSNVAAPPNGTGILSVGDGSNLGSSYVRPYLPVGGASIYTLFGVGPGIDYQAATNAYVNPANVGVGGIDYLTYIAQQLGETPDQAWITFQALPSVQQELLIERAFLKFLAQVSVDYNDPTSPYFQKYARAYQAIATLFPASYGYTDNTPKGTSGASSTVSTGDLNIARSVLETQTGGDIILIGPGGNIIVGQNATDNSKPSQEGILTLQGGSILGYTDQSVVVYQSRIFTEQGGDIDLFSANGDLNAGKGPKSSASFPPLSVIWDADGYARVNPAGLVTGAGIGALLSVPGQDPAKSNAVLSAPHGIVDAGAAGIRVAGNLNIVALQVLNAFNIDVGGKTFGLPPQPVTNLTLTTASDAATDAATITQSLAARQPHADVEVEVTGYGGTDVNHPERCIPARDHDCSSQN